MKQKTYLCIKFCLTSVCAVLFILHSYKEIGKFFSNMTSISIQTVAQVVDIRFPQIVVCLKEPFKGNRSAESLEEFREMTYSYDEVFGDLSPNISQGMKITEIATFVYGRCFVFEMPADWKEGVLIGFKTDKHVKVYLVDKGQELCLVNSLVWCDVQIEAIVLREFFHESKTKMKQHFREPR